MVRFYSALLIACLFAGLSVTGAEPEPLTGSYKVSLFSRGRFVVAWILRFEAKDGKQTAEVVATPDDQFKADGVEGIKIKDGELSFVVKNREGDFHFEGKLPAGKGAPIKGSLSLGRVTLPAQLAVTKLTQIKEYDLAREAFEEAQGEDIFGYGEYLIQEAGKEKADPKDVRSWVDKTLKAAEPFGKRWQREMAVRCVDALNKHEEYASVAVEAARRAERTVNDTDDPALQVRVLELLISALKKENKDANVTDLTARLDKLEDKADQEYLKKTPPFKVDIFPGRKEDTNQVAVVELFTGVECPPCVACDVAFDALDKAFRPTEVVLLQYHLNIPRPDPLTIPAGNERFTYYTKGEGGTPTFAINGTVSEMRGGPLSASEARYASLREVIDPLVNKKTDIQLKVAASRKGDTVKIQAEVEGVDKPGEKMRLRFALVEEVVRFTGGNTIRLHHRVVRAMPGGAQGIEIKEKSFKQSESVDLKDLREQLHKYLNEVSKEDAFRNDKRPMEFKKLGVVCFVQNDENKEILQAVQVDVKDE